MNAANTATMTVQIQQKPLCQRMNQRYSVGKCSGSILPASNLKSKELFQKRGLMIIPDADE
jgi:hypothetical protein